MRMSINDGWEKLVRERVDTTKDLVIVTKADVESVTGNELRLMAKIDSSDALPEALRRHGYFILPVKNGEYVLVRGNGFHKIEGLSEPITVFRPKLDFELATLNVGNSESQHLDYCFNVGLIEKFADVTGLRQTIRGRKRMPAIDFCVGNIGPIHVQQGVQVEVDLGCEGRADIVLVEAKLGQPKDFIIRQLFYPYRMWMNKIPEKNIRPWFFCSEETGGRRLYRFWQYRFADDNQYNSLVFDRGAAFLVEAQRARLSVNELLREHHKSRKKGKLWDVPQADDFIKVAELPLMVEQGIDTADKVAVHFDFDPRQSSYYRQAAEFLGLVAFEDKGKYGLTDLGREYVNRAADERREILAGLLVQFPPMRAALELFDHARERGVGKKEVARLIEDHSKITQSTPGRRASTLIAWMKWLKLATGSLKQTGDRFFLQSDG